MGILQGVVTAAILLCIGILLAISFLNLYFLLVLLGYLAITILYSFMLKQLQTVDVITLASLYTIRIVAGAAAIGVALSFWLLCYSMFLFLSLAIVKRVSELIHVEKQKGHASEHISGRGYFTSDIVVLQSLGGASGFMSVLVIALYINSDQVVKMYSSPEILWLVIPVVGYWVMRIWIIAARGQLNEDPISFAIRDRNSWVTAFLLVLFFVMAPLL
jgi:4-hydroxybenzoate polyprenyltransferase